MNDAKSVAQALNNQLRAWTVPPVPQPNAVRQLPPPRAKAPPPWSRESLARVRPPSRRAPAHQRLSNPRVGATPLQHPIGQRLLRPDENVHLLKGRHRRLAWIGFSVLAANLSRFEEPRCAQLRLIRAPIAIIQIHHASIASKYPAGHREQTAKYSYTQRPKPFAEKHLGPSFGPGGFRSFGPLDYNSSCEDWVGNLPRRSRPS